MKGKTPKQVENEEKKLKQLKMDEKLIEEVKANPILYDTNLKEYKETTARRSKWLQVTANLGLKKG